MMMKPLIMLIAIFFAFTASAQTVRDFQLKSVDNSTKSFSELKGEKLTAIDFWATWCKPCTKAMPELNEIYNTFKDKGFEMIGISCDGPRSISKVGPMINSMKIDYPVLLDINSEIKNELSLMALPTLILVNAEGKIVWVHEGFVTGDTEVIISEIEKNLNNN